MKEFFTSLHMVVMIQPRWLVVLLHALVELASLVLVSFFYYALFVIAGAMDFQWAARVAISFVAIKWVVRLLVEFYQGIKRKRALSISAEVK